MNVQEDNMTAASRRIPSHQRLTERSLLISNEIKDKGIGEGVGSAVANALGKRSHGDGHEHNNGAEVAQPSKRERLTQSSTALANGENAVLQLRADRPVANGESSEAAAQQTRQGQGQLTMLFNMMARRALRLGSQGQPTGSSSITDAAVSEGVDNLCSEIAQLDSRQEAIGQQIAFLQGQVQNANANLSQQIAVFQGQVQSNNASLSQQITVLQGQAQNSNASLGQQIAVLQVEAQNNNASLDQRIAVLQGQAWIINASIAEKIDEVLAREEL
jgi:hypothetical protein